jgi:hypothetical protein
MDLAMKYAFEHLPSGYFFWDFKGSDYVRAINILIDKLDSEDEADWHVSFHPQNNNSDVLILSCRD